MQLLKPSWVNHDGKPIFSIDIHPNGERFATGGQGADSGAGRVAVWNMAPIFDDKAEKNENCPKLLCQMDNHLACVNVVRWNCDGNVLASGGDDKLVMIWKLAGEGGGRQTIFGKVNVEMWRCVCTLRGHGGDVLDLAWAPHGDWLASCSVDNTVIVWNSQNFPEMVTLIKGHTGLVKGVTWDPVGKYLASQSDDKSLRVWRTGQWDEEVVITNPFEECSGTTHVLRLSWSPDGQYLVSAHAMNGGGPTAQIIERDGWKQDKDFVGHRKAVTCVKFNSNIFQRQFTGNAKPQQYCCCAIGSRDRSFSVWLTSLQRPLFVMREIFTSSVLDITWSQSGLILMACSWDGTVACILFDENELGKRLSSVEKNLVYERLYGKSLENNWNDRNSTSNLIIENPELLKIREKQELLRKQKTNSENLSKRFEGKTIVNSKINSNQSTNVNSFYGNGELTNNHCMDENSNGVRPIKQVETRLPSGKRRITPMFLEAPLTPSKQLLKDAPASIPKVSALNLDMETEDKSNNETKQEDNLSIVITTTKIVNRTEVDTNLTNPVEVINSDWRKDRPTTNQLPSVILETTRPESNRLESGTSESGTSETNRLNVSSIKRKDAKYTLLATNNCIKTAHGKLSRLELFENDEELKELKNPIWQTYFGSNVICLSNSSNIITVGCVDSLLYTINLKTGARLLPPIVLHSPATLITISTRDRCCLITRTNTFYLWDFWPMTQAKNLVYNQQLPSNFNSQSLKFNSINEPILILNDGRAYIYSLKLNSWLILSDPKDQLFHYVMPGPSNDKLPLAFVQRPCLRPIKSLETTNAALTHLQSQIVAAIAINSPIEYKYWLIATVKYLLQRNDSEKNLRDILDDLLGVPGAAGKSAQILGFNKRDLLLDVLNLFSTHLKWQRLYTEYLEQID